MPSTSRANNSVRSRYPHLILLMRELKDESGSPSNCQSWDPKPMLPERALLYPEGAPLQPVLDKGTSVPETQAYGFPWDPLCALESNPDYHFRNVP